MSEPTHPEVAILNAALEFRGLERAVYLDKACAGDAVLRQRVEALLRAHEQAENFLEAPPAGLDFKRTAPVNMPLTEKPGDKIGRYKLLQQIGEGGCGVVYMAEQEEPVCRRVALKVIKLGMDTKSVIARFEAERQALALMDHPNIAKVLDAGATETGRPYFVMELVRGIKITEFCDENKVSTEDRLKLFIQVCQAIQHAHQKGVIHRDIKPSNILVTVNDGVPVPKVIDFGIAKATQGRLTDKTLFTAFEQFIGTPAYMSPEQAVMTSLDIDTRSDIYSLGVLLYELLTGKTPFDAKELLQAGLDEMRRTILEIEPPKPSTRLTQELVSKSEIGNRKSEIKETIHLLRGDLDWIVMKCLEKDRTRRYETANGVVTDINRHLNDEPIVARPPSNIYRFRKAVQRNKLAFAAACAVFASLLLGFGISLGMYFQERSEFRRAVIADSNAEQARHSEARMQVRIDDIMNLMQREGKNSDAEQLLDEVVTRAVANDLQRAQLLQLRAVFLAQHGRWNEAATNFNKSVGLHPEITYQSDWGCYLLATILVQSGQLDAYREHCRKSLQLFGATTNQATAERISKVCVLLPSSGVDLEAVSKMTDAAMVLSKDSSAMAWAKLSKGMAEYRLGHFESAVECEQNAFSTTNGPSDRFERQIEACMVLAMANHQLNHLDEARSALAKGIEIEKEKSPKIESGNLGGNWMDWIITHTLMHEAKELIEGQPAPAAKETPEPH
jgi:serine/threonine protein kinase